eukprot:gene8727-biopygen601
MSVATQVDAILDYPTQFATIDAVLYQGSGSDAERRTIQQRRGLVSFPAAQERRSSLATQLASDAVPQRRSSPAA